MARSLLDNKDPIAGSVTAHDFPDGAGLKLIDEAREPVPDVTCVRFTAHPLSDVACAYNR